MFFEVLMVYTYFRDTVYLSSGSLEFDKMSYLDSVWGIVDCIEFWSRL